MIENITEKIVKLSIKLRILKSRLGKNSRYLELNDRQIVSLEMLSLIGNMKVTDLCRNFCEIGQSTISADIKLFRQKGWVRKKFSKNDERVHIIGLTDEGKELVKEIRKRRLENFAPLTMGIGTDVEEIKIIEKVVSRINFELDSILDINLDNSDNNSKGDLL